MWQELLPSPKPASQRGVLSPLSQPEPFSGASDEVLDRKLWGHMDLACGWALYSHESNLDISNLFILFFSSGGQSQCPEETRQMLSYWVAFIALKTFPQALHSIAWLPCLPAGWVLCKPVLFPSLLRDACFSIHLRLENLKLSPQIDSRKHSFV